MTASAAPPGELSQRNWDELLSNIEARQVIPIIGPDLVLVERDGRPMTLERYVALELVHRLEITLGPEDGAPEPSLHQAMCAYFRNIPRGETRRTPYNVVHQILSQTRFPTPDPLRKLAEITDFMLFVSTTFDSLLSAAIDEVRHGGVRSTTSIVYRYNRTEDLPCSVEELVEQHRPTVFHLLGKADPQPYYVLTDEDLLEFVCSLQSSSPPERLLGELASRHLLVLGENYPDWLARLFLRTTRGKRLSLHHEATEIVADTRTPAQAELVSFLTHFSHTLVVHGGAVRFVNELHDRWCKRHPAPAGDVRPAAPYVPPPREMPRHAVFLSYNREDLEVVKRLKAQLEATGLPVWFDKDQLMGGQDYTRRIEENIRGCVLFLPVMSRTTERERRGVYFRAEWNAAMAQRSRFAPGEVFIVPLVVDDLERRKAELEFPGVHVEQAPGGVIDPRLLDHLWQEYSKATGVARPEAR